MNPEDDNQQKDRKQFLKEKKELKLLERFMYDPKEISLRESTRKIIRQENYYTDLIKLQAKKNEEVNLINLKGKKRGRKPKERLQDDQEVSILSSSVNEINSLQNKKKKAKDLSKNKNLSGGRIISMINFNPEECESTTSKNLTSICNTNNNLNECSSYLSNSEVGSIKAINGNNAKGKISEELIHSSIVKNQWDDVVDKKEVCSNFDTSKIETEQINTNSEFYNESELYRQILQKEYPREVEKYNSKINNLNGFMKKENGEETKNSNHFLPQNNSLQSKTFINCDLRFFNFDLITSRIGHFDVIMIDPPWRIKGGQRNDSSFMFSNSKFNLEYNTLSNNEIVSLPVEKLSKKGFCFLWILNSLMNVGYECLNKWGYDVVDQITWVKTRNEKLYISQGYYFLHSSETCLVGYKCPANERVEYKSKIATNIMFGNIRGKSQKPEEIYELIEKMMPGSKKIELFARNNNLRQGWLSLGNQLGENYQSWKNIITCDNCNKNINVGIKRYKSKIIPNYDVCQKCYDDAFKNKPIDGNNYSDSSLHNQEKIVIFQTDLSSTLNNHKSNNFFEIKNNVDEDILHQYYSCNDCNSEPIWGNRFHCSTCQNFDLCEACFDKEILNESLKENPHVLVHDFKCFEVAELASGMSTHNDYRCKFCFQKPIVGPCFECIDCKNLTICQNCYFNSSYVDDKHFNINSDHKFTIQIKTKNKLSKYVKCFGCAKEPIEKIRFKCNNCFDFNLCELCYKDRLNKEFLASSHKNYHTFNAFYL